MSEWFCQSDGGVQGPLSWDELTYLAKRGRITPQIQVRHGASGHWVAAKSVAGLLTRQPATQAVRQTADALGGSSRKSSLPSPVGARRNGTPPSGAPTAEESATADTPTSVPAPQIVYQRPADPHEAEKQAQQRRVVIASILTGMALLAALCLLIWMLMSAPGGGAGGGTSSLGGKGKAGEGSQQGEQESVLDNGADGDAGNEADSTEAGSNAASSNATTPPPPPLPSTAAPVDATAAANPNPNGNSRFSIGGSDFFGLSANGNSFIYIVDCSGSMSGGRFEMAKRELLRSIYGLDDDKKVFVIFFSDTHYPMFYPQSGQNQALPSNLPNKDRIRQWVENFGVMGGTAPDTAIELALQMQSDAIYLLTDGGFDDSAIHLAKRNNARKIPINTIGFQDRGGESGLKRIAADSGGKYKFVP